MRPARGPKGLPTKRYCLRRPQTIWKEDGVTSLEPQLDRVEPDSSPSGRSRLAGWTLARCDPTLFTPEATIVRGRGQRRSRLTSLEVVEAGFTGTRPGWSDLAWASRSRPPSLSRPCSRPRLRQNRWRRPHSRLTLLAVYYLAQGLALWRLTTNLMLKARFRGFICLNAMPGATAQKQGIRPKAPQANARVK